MARGFSKAIITGNVTRDPELRTTPSGAQVCSFSVAVNRNYRDNNGAQQETVSFIDCVAWAKSAEIIAQYAKKGTAILVSGRLEQRSWDDQKTGQKRSRVEIVVEDFNFLGGGGNSVAGNGNYGNSNYQNNAAPVQSPASSTDTIAPSGDVVPTDIPEDGNIDLSEIPF